MNIIDNDISRFCELVKEINKLNKKLKKKKANFYNGGYSFEECHEAEIKELIKLQNELVDILHLNTL